MNPYNTHLPILSFITKHLDCDSIFEFGTGFCSTPFFSKNFKTVISIEMQDEEWYKKVAELDLPNTSIHCMLGMKLGLDYFETLPFKFSCVFVDGHGGNRWECINKAFDKTDIIVTHDTETSGYEWHLVQKPNNFIWLDILNFNPWTSVITKNKDLISKLKNEFQTKERNF